MIFEKKEKNKIQQCKLNKVEILHTRGNVKNVSPSQYLMHGKTLFTLSREILYLERWKCNYFTIKKEGEKRIFRYFCLKINLIDRETCERDLVQVWRRCTRRKKLENSFDRRSVPYRNLCVHACVYVCVQRGARGRGELKLERKELWPRESHRAAWKLWPPSIVVIQKMVVICCWREIVALELNLQRGPAAGRN